jgi:hypothetical protein
LPLTIPNPKPKRAEIGVEKRELDALRVRRPDAIGVQLLDTGWRRAQMAKFPRMHRVRAARF